MFEHELGNVIKYLYDAADIKRESMYKAKIKGIVDTHNKFGAYTRSFGHSWFLSALTFEKERQKKEAQKVIKDRASSALSNIEDLAGIVWRALGLSSEQEAVTFLKVVSSLIIMEGVKDSDLNEPVEEGILHKLISTGTEIGVDYRDVGKAASVIDTLYQVIQSDKD